MRNLIPLLVAASLLAACGSTTESNYDGPAARGFTGDGERVAYLHLHREGTVTRYGPYLPGEPPRYDGDVTEMSVSLRVLDPDTGKERILAENLDIPPSNDTPGLGDTSLYYREHHGGFLTMQTAHDSTLIWDIGSRRKRTTDRRVVPSPSGHQLMVFVSEPAGESAVLRLLFVATDTVLDAPRGRVNLRQVDPDAAGVELRLVSPRVTCVWQDDATVVCQDHNAFGLGGTKPRFEPISTWAINTVTGDAVATQAVADGCVRRNEALTNASGDHLRVKPDDGFTIERGAGDACPWAR